jgi:hypothetical protein
MSAPLHWTARMDKEKLSIPIANCTPTDEPPTLSSRPERSAVEGSAVSLLGFSRRLFSPCEGSRQGLKAPGHLARGGTTKVVP